MPYQAHANENARLEEFVAYIKLVILMRCIGSTLYNCRKSKLKIKKIKD